MTTAPDPDGTGLIDDVPDVPSARPAPAEPFGAPECGSAVPGLPPVDVMPTASPQRASVYASSVAVAPSGARAPLDPGTDTHPSRRDDEPVYGSLPAASDESAEASRRLRAEAQRRRRRNARVGWVVTVVLFAAAVVVSWFVYQAFEGEGPGADATPAAPNADAGDVPAEQESPTEADVAALSPAEQGDRVGSTPSGGDGLEAVERPDYRTITYDVRIYSGTGVDAPYRHFGATYDVVSDDYAGLLRDSSTAETTVVSFDGEWSYTTGTDGINHRVRRSKFSAQPAPDTRLAELLDEHDVLPDAARPFSTLVSSEEAGGTSPTIDGTTGTVAVHELDLDAFRAADPAAHAAWWSLWATALPDSVDLIVPGSEQVQLREVTPLDLEWENELLDVGGIELDATAGRTVIASRVTERGVVDAVVIVSPEANVRIVYVASEYSDEPGAVVVRDDGIWVDAP